MSMTREDNELLTRVENGAPMGRMLREHYWFPAALSQKLVADGPPQRVKLLGESYVAWRATDGRVGFFDESCPHRRVSLALARNEDNALRCIFHGWKFNVAGQVVEVPTEPHNATEFCKHVPLRHYPVREAAGIAWVWLGTGAVGVFPDFEFMHLPEEQAYSVYQTCSFNWIQSTEAVLDAAHVPILHQSWMKELSQGGDFKESTGNLAPVFEFDDRIGGFRYAAIRGLRDGRKYIRVTEFIAPWYGFAAPTDAHDGDRTCVISVPADDVTTINWFVRYNPFKAIRPSIFHAPVDRGNWPPYPAAGPEKLWGQDRAAMAKGHFTGFTQHILIEDYAITASLGAIASRTDEYLNSGDRAIVKFRNMLLGAVRQFGTGKVPDLARHEEIPYAKIRPTGDIIPASADWRRIAA